MKIMQTFGKAIVNFQTKSFLETYEELCDNHCPYRKNRQLSKVQHFQVELLILSHDMSVHSIQKICII